MKRLLWLLTMFPLVSCASSQPLTHQRLLALSNGMFQFGATVTDLSTALSMLGSPETTQINLVACPDLRFSAIQEAKDRLAEMGYKRIGFAAISDSERAACGMGANSSFKPKPLRGSA